MKAMPEPIIRVEGLEKNFRIRTGTIGRKSLIHAVNGVSLTVGGLGDDWLQVDVIPTTAAETNLGALCVGDKVNLESDVLGKYVRRRAEMEGEPPPASGDRHSPDEGGLTFETLAANGFM